MKPYNLDELQNIIGQEIIEKCFTEYALLVIAKAKRFDDFICELDKMKASDRLSVSEIKNKLL